MARGMDMDEIGLLFEAEARASCDSREAYTESGRLLRINTEVRGRLTDAVGYRLLTRDQISEFWRRVDHARNTEKARRRAGSAPAPEEET